ncbi:MAG: YihY/virulence factor BrkB family protein [Ilumatobacteraceae bacterium]
MHPERDEERDADRKRRSDVDDAPITLGPPDPDHQPHCRGKVADGQEAGRVRRRNCCEDATITTRAIHPHPNWTEKGFVLRLRDRFRPLDFVFGGIDGFLRHKTGRHAALLAHYGFLSVFPMLVVLTTILGYVLESRPNLRAKIVGSAFANIPIVGETIGSNPSSLKGNIFVLVIGLATTLWAGSKAFVATQNGMNDIWGVPEHERPNLPKSRARSLLAVGVVGGSQIAASIVSGIIGIAGVSWLSRILLALATIAINIGLLTIAYRILTARPLHGWQLWPGAIGAGIGFSILQVVTGTVVASSIKSATPVYGNFAAVIALLTWLSLHAMVALIGVEANASLSKHGVRHGVRHGSSRPAPTDAPADGDGWVRES